MSHWQVLGEPSFLVVLPQGGGGRRVCHSSAAVRSQAFKAECDFTDGAQLHVIYIITYCDTLM